MPTEHLRPRFNWYTAALLLASATYLYANLFVSLTTPFLLSGDQVYFWMNALRMLHGERIYQDFFQFTPPGTDLIYLGAFKLFGPRIWVCSAIVLALGVALSWVCFKTAKLTMERSQALLAAGLFLVLIYGNLLNGTHHWFSLIAVMLAVAILMKASSPVRIVIAGILLGITSFFTQTRGPAASLGIALYLIWEKVRNGESWPKLIKRQALLVLAFIGTLAILSGYFMAATGIRQLWYFQITYVRQYMLARSMGSVLGLPEISTWRALPAIAQPLFVYGLLPVVYAIALWRCWKRRRDSLSSDSDRIALLALVGTALLLEVAQSVNWLRIYCIAMPGIILFIWILGSTKFRTCAMSAVWIAVFCLASLQIWARHHHESLIAELPAGKAAVSPIVNEKLDWLLQHTASGQLLFQAGWPGFYLPLGLDNPVYLDVLETGELTRPQYVELSIQELESKRVQYILWSPRLDSPASEKSSQAYHLAAFAEFLRSRYRRIRIFSDQDEVWERK